MVEVDRGYQEGEDRYLKVVDEEDPETWMPASRALDMIAETLKRKHEPRPAKDDGEVRQAVNNG